MIPTDKFSVRTVVIVLSIVAIGSLAAMVGLTGLHQQVPDSIDRAFTLALGALIGVLAKTSTNEGAAQDVNVVNDPAKAGEAIPVVAAAAGTDALND